MRAATLRLLILAAVLLQPGPLAAAPVPVRFTEGVTHGFLQLRTVDGALIASGDLFQVVRGGQVEKRMVFHFKDGSVFEEAAVFTQQQVYTMQSYRLVRRGPVFSEDAEITLERATGKYRVKTKAHNDGREGVLDGSLDLPADVYNGMILTVVKDLPKGPAKPSTTLRSRPRPGSSSWSWYRPGEHRVLVGDLQKPAVHYVLKPRLGIWLKFFATVLGLVPPDDDVWIVTEEVPAFVRFEGPLYTAGPVWRIELTSPRWPDQKG